MTKEEFKKKWENYWYHYKSRTWVIIFVIAALCYTVFEFVSTKVDDIVITYIGKYANYAGIAEEIETNFGDVLEDVSGNKTIKVSAANILATSNAFEGDMVFWQRIDINFLNGQSYLYFVDEPIYKYLSGRNLLGKIKTAEGEVDFIDVTENEYFSKYVYNNEKLYLCVRGEFAETPDKKIVMLEENSKKVLKKILENN